MKYFITSREHNVSVIEKKSNGPYFSNGVGIGYRSNAVSYDSIRDAERDLKIARDNISFTYLEIVDENEYAVLNIMDA